MPALEKERAFLDSHRDELLREYGGKFLIIKEEEVVGAFDTIEQALENATLHGLGNVLIRRPSEAQINFSVPALTLGIIHANPTHADSGSGQRR